MTIRFFGGNITDNKVGILNEPGASDVEAHGTNFARNDIAIWNRGDVKTTLRSIGLPESAEPLQLATLLTELRALQAQERQAHLGHSSWLQRNIALMKDGTTVMTNILNIAADPRVPALIDWLLQQAQQLR